MRGDKPDRGDGELKFHSRIIKKRIAHVKGERNARLKTLARLFC